MKFLRVHFACYIAITLIFSFTTANAQTTVSWRGGTGNDGDRWDVAGNWSPAVIPNANTHVLIGDFNYTGKHPILDLDKATGACMSLTIGGVKTASLDILDSKPQQGGSNKNVNVDGQLTIHSNGTLRLKGTTLNLKGDWLNNGVYSEEYVTSGTTGYLPTLNFAGTSQILGGTSTSSFVLLVINSSTTLAANVTVRPLITSARLIVGTGGKLDPADKKVSWPNGGNLDLRSGSILQVKASTYLENYDLRPAAGDVNATAVIEYASSTNQSVDNLVPYQILKISGGGTKSLVDNTAIANEVEVAGGTLDLLGYTLNRTAAGGKLTVASGATLRIGSTRSMPTGYSAYTFNANSTVNYYGTAQTVANHTYGHLTLSNTGNKTLPNAAMTVNGNFTNQGTVSSLAGGNMTVGGNVTIGTGSTFNGSTFTHTVSGNWAADGTYVPGTSTVVMAGAGRSISSTSGATEFNNLTLSGTGTSITVPALTIRGDLSANGGLSQTAGGTITMTNSTSRSISGSNVIFQNIVIDGTVSTGIGFNVHGNFTTNANKSFSATAGTINMLGSNRAISGTGSMTFWGLSIGATTSSASSFTINSSLSGAASLTAPAGTVTFDGVSTTYSGNHNLFNVNVPLGRALTLSSNATLGVAGALTSGGSFIATANGSTVDYNGPGQQNVLVTAYHHLKLSNSSTKTFGAGTTRVAGSLSVASGAGSEFLSNASTIDFNGSGAQDIPGLSYHRVLLSSGGIKTLTGNAGVASELRLSNGRINTGANKFILGNTATLVESEGNYVTGFVETQRNMTTAMETFGGIGISVTPAVSPGSVTVLRETGRAIVAGNGNTSVLRNFSFTVGGTNSKLDATVSFNYLEHELNGYDESTLMLFYPDASSSSGWAHNGSSVASPTSNRVGANGIGRLTQLTLGSSVSPLPVEMKYFRAERRGHEALLSWETAAERDHQGFEVEVSVDGKAYRRLGFVASAGTGTGPGGKYSFTDTEAGKAGVRYYRLKQLDLDGTHAYYGPRAVDFGQAKAAPLQAYPNPFKDNLHISFENVGNATAKAALYTLAGKAVLVQELKANSGINDFKIDTDNVHLSSGMYLLLVEVDGKKKSIKVTRD